MDINLLLSPQESPRGTSNRAPPVKAAAKKSKKQRATKVSQLSPLADTTLPPPTLPHSAVVQAQHVARSPSAMSPSSGHRISAASTPPDGIHVKRQPSTPGMDTLADLASMQHHQQTARANAGGLRSDVIYENPTSSTSTLPNLLAMSRPRASSQLMGGPLDVSMTDESTDTSSRRLSTSALSEEQLQRVAQLINELSSNPFAYESHVQLVNLLHRGLSNHAHPHSPSNTPGEPHTYDLLQDLHNARQTMNSRFAMGEDLWADWIADQILLARSLEDRIAIMELCQKAVDEETNSTKLWLAYGHFMLSLYKQANPQDQRVAHIGEPLTHTSWTEEDRMIAREVFSWPQMMTVWERAIQDTALRLNDSHFIWDIYTRLLLLDLASSPSHEEFARVQYHFITRLQTPHSTWDQTFQAYSSFISKYDNASYEKSMVTANRLGAEARDRYGRRERMELRLSHAMEKHDREDELEAFESYIEEEVSQSHMKKHFDFTLANALYQRVVLRFPARTELWEGYAMLLNEEIAYHKPEGLSVFPVLHKATQHCPWSGTLWSQYLLAAEINKMSFRDIEDIKHKATSNGLQDAGGMEEVLKINTAWCGFLRRRAFLQDSTDEEIDVAEVGIRSAIEDMETTGRQTGYPGDPEYRLAKIYIKYLTQTRNWENARQTWKGLIQKRGDSYDFWIRYYIWEMNTWSTVAYNGNASNGTAATKPVEATMVLQKAMKREDLDWPEKIIEVFQYHCEDNEDAKELQSSLAQIWKAKKQLSKKRKEAYRVYEAAQAEALQHQEEARHEITTALDGSGNTCKRKRQDIAGADGNKKFKSEVLERNQLLQTQEQHLPAPSTLRRDRENTTVVVKNLPLHTTDTRVRQFFRDCGTIKSLELVPEAHAESATAAIEFDTKDDVLAARTKDMKILDGNTINVQVDSGSTLYVCNFPPTADETWVRDKFQKYGEITDIRFPSLKFNTHRRFCYVQFESSSDAQAATELDGEALGNDLKLLAKISNPSHKQDRHGAIYEGREIYISHLDWHATSKDVKQVFSKYGKVESIRVPTKVDRTSKGIAFVVFSNSDEATAALEMNLTRLRNRVIYVSISTNDKAKRQASRIDSQRNSASPAPESLHSGTNGIAPNAATPTPPADGPNRYNEIQSRTLALMNIPDTINDARIRALAESYGEIIQLRLRPDHQGATIEYKEQASVGKAALGLEGHEIIPGRLISTGTIAELIKQKPEKKIDGKPAVSNKPSAPLKLTAPIRRPNQSGARRGGKGGLGIKRGGVGLSGPRATMNAQGTIIDPDKNADTNAADPGEKATPKSNAEFKALFINK